MLSHSQMIKMPQSIAFSSTLVTVNGSVVPAAASQSVHVNGSVVPATASRPAHVQTVDDISAHMSNMSISKPTVIKPTSASVLDRIAERRRRVAANIAPSAYTASVLDRFAERRRRVTANIAPSVNDAPSVNKASTDDRIAERRRRRAAIAPSVTADVAPSANTAPVLDRIAERRRRVAANITPSVTADVAPSVNKASIDDRIAERRRRRAAANITPSVTANIAPSVKKASVGDRIAERHLRVAANIAPPVNDGKARGTSRYCPGRPKIGSGQGPLGYHTLRKGRLCTCPDHVKTTRKWHVRPKEWLTTPAETGRDRWPKPKKSNKKVHWPEQIATVFEGEKPWDQVLEAEPTTSDWTPREEDFPEGFCVTVN